MAMHHRAEKVCKVKGAAAALELEPHGPLLWWKENEKDYKELLLLQSSILQSKLFLHLLKECLLRPIDGLMIGEHDLMQKMAHGFCF
jgi:hypothetical protein